jgi:hypothetical protein
VEENMNKVSEMCDGGVRRFTYGYMDLIGVHLWTGRDRVEPWLKTGQTADDLIERDLVSLKPALTEAVRQWVFNR